MNITQFFLKYNGKHVDVDGVYGPQCVDLIKAYFQEVLGRDPLKGNAIDYWFNPPTNFTKISRTPWNRPEPGDIIVWSSTSLNPYGHIAVVNWSRWLDVGVFEQNNPIGSPCHYSDRTYKGVLGWLRPAPKPEIDICVVNAQYAPTLDFIAKVEEYTKKSISLRIRPVSAQINVPSGTFGTEAAMKLIDDLNIRERFIFICYPANADSAYEVASYHPTKNSAFATIPYPFYTTIMVHAFLHLLRKYINFNKLGPYVEDLERYPTNWSDAANFDNPGWRFVEQYEQLIPYFKWLK